MNLEECSSSLSFPYMYILIGNIPISFHTPDLRNFFSYSIENESFICFNYRHRPDKSKKFNVCVSKIKECKFDELIKLYDRKNWIDTKGILLLTKCTITKIKVIKYSNSINEKNDDTLTEKEINSLLEFKNIPCWMENGNVGTPTKVFLTYINQCIMPQSLISKLGLNLKNFRKHKKKKYSNVDFDYNQLDIFDDKEEEEFYLENISDEHVILPVALTANGHKINLNIDDESKLKEINYMNADNEKEKYLNDNEEEKNQNNEEDNDGDDLEEWERHEALNDDVTKQDRTSPYFFEHEVELKWEKGSSGLVFYTDNNFWKDQENKDFDEETADDLDIDMRVYYESNSGDKDANDMIEMSQQDMLRRGVASHLLDDIKRDRKSKLNPFEANPKKSIDWYTKGLGRKLLEKHGWKEGESVGDPNRSGLKKALDHSDGKLPNDRSGIGYYGEKVDKEKLIKEQKLIKERERRSAPYYIASKFDNDTEKPDTLLRRFEPTNKYKKF